MQKYVNVVTPIDYQFYVYSISLYDFILFNISLISYKFLAVKIVYLIVVCR